MNVTKRSYGNILVVAAALTLLALSAQAQLPSITDANPDSSSPAAGPLPEWDVSLLKPHGSDDHNMMWSMTPDGLSLMGLPLEQLICNAWNIKSYQISGLTGWMKSSTFDLTAKVSADDLAAYKKLNGEQRRLMLQRLLIERFQLKFHLETKTLPLYNLVVDKAGSKLEVTKAIEPSPEDDKAHPQNFIKRKGSMMMAPGMYQATGVPVNSLVSQLSNVLGKPVNDTTGLTGSYDITLHYRPEEETGDTGDKNADLPPLLSAIQEQLGLKLVPGKGPVETLIVDDAQKPQAD